MRSSRALAKGELSVQSLDQRWLDLEPDYVGRIVGAITADNSRSVWLEEKPRANQIRSDFTYPGLLVELPADVAEELNLHHQFRKVTTPEGEVITHEGEVVLTWEAIGRYALLERGIGFVQVDQTTEINPTLEEALEALNLIGRLPERPPRELGGESDDVDEFVALVRQSRELVAAPRPRRFR